jgi:hypothetical protein
MAAHCRPIDGTAAAETIERAVQGPKGELQWTFVPEVALVEVSWTAAAAVAAAAAATTPAEQGQV